MRCKNRTLSEWLSIIMESRKSGLTDIEWCRRNDINYEAFKTAAKRLRGASITLPRRTKPNCIDLTAAARHDVVKVDIINDPSSELNLPIAMDPVPAIDSPTDASIIVRLKAGEIRIENSADPTLVSCILQTIGGLSC